MEEIDKETTRLIAIIAIPIFILTITLAAAINQEREISLKKAEAEIKLKEAKAEYYEKILKGEERQWTTY